MKKATIHDVAAQAGVSAATVSRVLNGRVRVRPSKAGKVRDAMQALGYRPNPYAHRLAIGQTSRTVGLISWDLHSEFFAQVTSAFEETLWAAGLRVIYSSSHGRADDEARCLEFMSKHDVEGLFLMAPNLPDANLLNFLERIPAVLMNRYIPELSHHCILLDNRRGAYLATRHLLELGHRRIAWIGAPLTRQYARHRLEGYSEALREFGLVRDDKLVIETDDHIYADSKGIQAVERLLRLGEFSAIFAGNDLLAAGALKVLGERGIQVPGDISIIGFDDIALSQLTNPTLSTMHYPKREMGAAAATHLIALIEGKTPDLPQRFEAHLIARESSAQVKHALPQVH